MEVSLAELEALAAHRNPDRSWVGVRTDHFKQPASPITQSLHERLSSPRQRRETQAIEAKQLQAKRIRDEGVSKRQERFRLQMDRAEEAARRVAKRAETLQLESLERLEKAAESREEALARVKFKALTSIQKVEEAAFLTELQSGLKKTDLDKKMEDNEERRKELLAERKGRASQAATRAEKAMEKRKKIEEEQERKIERQEGRQKQAEERRVRYQVRSINRFDIHNIEYCYSMLLREREQTPT